MINKKICSAANSRYFVRFVLEISGVKNYGLLLEILVLVGLGRSGRLIGSISTYFRPDWSWWLEAMTKKLKGYIMRNRNLWRAIQGCIGPFKAVAIQ